MSILSTKQLTKQYCTEPNIVKALDGVSISIEPGEFVAIIGTSGSGKSTLLNMLGGLDRPTSGKYCDCLSHLWGFYFFQFRVYVSSGLYL